MSAGFVVLAFWLLYSVNRERDDTSPVAWLEAIPAVRFGDITAEAGITFIHENGAYGEKLLPETMGGGCAFIDYDNDGDQDILFVNSGLWPWQARENQQPVNVAALYRNNGHGQFEDVSALAAPMAEFYGMGVAIGDYDNDGWTDVFISGVGRNALFRNDAGRFEEVTERAGLESTGQWSTSCAWFDYDNDGDLDLFVCNYVQWDRATDLKVDYQLPGIGRAYGPPLSFAGSFSQLYRNDGGRFIDVSAESGIQVRHPGTGLPLGKSLGVAPMDLNADGWIDLIVANDTVQNFMFSNRWDRTFAEVGALSGIAFDTFGGARGAMGIDSAQFQNDFDLAVAIGNFANEMTALYVSQAGQLMFSDEAIDLGIGHASRTALTFGVFFFDYDLDGWLDLLTTNGHIEPEIARLETGQSYRQPAQLFWNVRGTGNARGFITVPATKSGEELFQPIAGRGSAFADIDGDGDQDVLFTQVGGPPVLLENLNALNRSWIRFRLVGSRANRDAIGASIRLRTRQGVMVRQVMPTRGYLSQSELPVTFGLGQTQTIESIEITWPGGRKQPVTNYRLNSINIVREE